MGLWIAAIIILPFSFFLFVFYGLSNHHQTFKERYSFLNMFPYELSYHNQGRLLLFYRLFLYVYAAFSLTPALLLISKYFNYPSFLSYLALIGGIFVISAISFLTLHIIQAKFVRLHSLVATSYFASSVLSAGASSIFLINLYLSNNGTQPVFLFLGIVVAILGLFILAIMVNPRLRDWAKMNSQQNEDGTVVIVRPRIFVLALSEWLVIGLNLLVQIIILVAYIL